MTPRSAEVVAPPDFALAALEFDGVRDLLARRTRTPMGRRRALALAPTGDAGVVAARLGLAEETMALSREGIRLGFPEMDEPGAVLQRLAMEGSILEIVELRNLGRIAAAVEEARGLLRPARQQAPGLAALADSMPDLRPLSEAMRGIFAADGGLEDRASSELARLRSRTLALGDRLRQKLSGYLKGPAAESYLQDEFITQRNHRFVIPVRAESRSAVQGIVHGSSASGATLFVEPLETVELNNDLVGLRDAEAAEIRRILADLTSRARHCRTDLLAAVESLAQLDVLAATARLAQDADLRTASPAADGGILLRGARHLLLQEKLKVDGTVAVAIAVDLAVATPVLVISGPNTGGKTVALKTVGLAALMNQAGLPVPASQAALPVFSQVLADIGDHQSIAENLSTFSSHVVELARMTSRIRRPALVLMDELGTGTDPEEGSALGVAIVEHFQSHGALVILTTHHNGLKAYAQTHPGVVNASVEFDEVRLRPTFKLLVGLAGRSGGLDMAARLGLGESIIGRAKDLVSDGGRTTERYIVRLTELVAEAEERLGQAAAQLELAEEEHRRARREREEDGQRQHRRLEEDFAAARQRFDSSLEALLRSVQDTARGRALQRATEKARRAAGRQLRHEQEAAGAAVFPEAQTRLTVRDLWPGLDVLVRRLNCQGKIEHIDAAGAVAVSVGGKRVVLTAGDLALAPAALPVARGGVQIHADPGATEADLNLIGRRVEEALEALDRYLDRAVLESRNQVRIVHGQGTGRLKKAVREHLSGHAAVRDHRPGMAGEGGEGATLVRLKE